MRLQRRAESTRANYASMFKQYEAFCTNLGEDPYCGDADLICEFLFLQACQTDESGSPLSDSAGKLIRKSHVGSVQLKLYAIDFAYKQKGLPAPSKIQDVKDFMDGLRRTFGVLPDEPRAPIDFAALRRLLFATFAPALDEQVRHVARALHNATEATGGQLRKLLWEHVKIQGTTARLTLASPSRSRRASRVTVHATGDEHCPVEALLSLQELTGGQGPVLRNTSGQAMARTSIIRILRTSARPAERNATQGARDRVILLLGFWSAARRANISAAVWGDLDFSEPDQVVFTLRRSKTDREGRGHHVPLDRCYDNDPLLCPVTALLVWRDLVASELGVAPDRLPRNLPVLLNVDRHGRPVLKSTGKRRRVGLDAKSINTIIQDRADACGLTEEARMKFYGQFRHPYGAHSLRAGWVTEYIRNGGTLDGAARHLDQRKLAITSGYVRELVARLSSGNKVLVEALAAAARPR